MASISDPAQSADSSAAFVAFTAIANPGPASRLRYSVNPTNTFSGRPIRPAVTVSVVDAFDNPTGSAATITAALGGHAGTGVLSGTTRVDAAGGVGTFADLSIDQAATGYTLTASATGLTGATSAAFDVVTPGPAQIAFESARDGNNEIYVMNEDGSGLVNITNNPAYDYRATWSPDGSKIAFHSDRDGNREIYVMNADGSGLQNLTNNPGDDDAPVWSPDGGRITFVSARDGNFETYVMNADGAGLQNLTNNPGGDREPVWSPDGTKIAFVSWRGSYKGVYVMNADGSGVTQLIASSSTAQVAFLNPVWSPDGSKIAYQFAGISCFRQCHLATADIYVMNADGSGLHNLTNNLGMNGGPVWSPDGRRIAFSSNRDDGGYEIYLINADGSGEVNLTNSPDNDIRTAWRPR
jgi:Tol biopolymer transport system component